MCRHLELAILPTVYVALPAEKDGKQHRESTHVDSDMHGIDVLWTTSTSSRERQLDQTAAIFCHHSPQRNTVGYIANDSRTPGNLGLRSLYMHWVLKNRNREGKNVVQMRKGLNKVKYLTSYIKIVYSIVYKQLRVVIIVYRIQCYM